MACTSERALILSSSLQEAITGVFRSMHPGETCCCCNIVPGHSQDVIGLPQLVQACIQQCPTSEENMGLEQCTCLPLFQLFMCTPCSLRFIRSVPAGHHLFGVHLWLPLP